MSSNNQASHGRAQSARRPKISVGTVSTKIDFDPQTTVFKPSDVPEHARRAKEDVKRTLRTKQKSALEVQRPEWEPSVRSSLSPPCERLSRQLSVNDPIPLSGQSYNYRAETLPPKQPERLPAMASHFFGQRPATSAEVSPAPTGSPAATTTTMTWDTTRPATASRLLLSSRGGEMPTNPKLQGSRAWDATKTVSPKLIKQDRARLEAAAKRNSERIKRHLQATRRSGATGYLSPEQRYKQKLRARRKILDSGKGQDYLSKVRNGMLNPPPPHRPKLQLATKNKPRKIKVCLVALSPTPGGSGL